MTRLLFLFFLLSATFVNAAWFEISAVSSITINEQSARQNALEDAIFEALKFANADIASLEAIRPYLTKAKDNYLFSANEIREIQVINQEKKNNNVQLTIRIDIYPEAKACHKKLYKKKLLLANFNITDPEQAALGGIFTFGNSFTKLLKKQINKNSQSFIIQDITHFSLSAEQQQTIKMLSQEKNAQYVIFGEITDLTSTLDKKSDKHSNRQLAININVFNGQSGESFWQNNYRGIAKWTFDLTNKVDTETARFWASAYGEMAQNMSRDILLDLESQLACQATSAKIIALNQGEAKINAGRKQGVVQGDKLTLWHQSTFIDANGSAKQQLRKSNIQLRVIQVYENSAEIDISPAFLANSIQIGDLTTKITEL